MKQNHFLDATANHILSNVYQISTLLANPSSVDRVLTAIMETVKYELGFNRCSIYLIDRAEGTLECKYITGFTPEQEKTVKEKAFRLQKHACIETKVALTGVPILIKDFNSDPNVTDLDRIVTKNMERACTLYIPLKIKGNIMGILGVDKKQGESEISERELESLSIFAGYASIVIENSRLYEALLNEKKFSENVLKSSINGMFTVDVHGKITSLNPAAEEIFGIKKENTLGRSIESFYELNPELEKIFQFTILNNNSIENCEYVFKKGEKQSVILSMSSSSIFDDTGNITGVLFTVQDVTSARERHKYLQRVNRLISLGELAAGVAHEVRNPLTGISVVLDILRGRKNLSVSDMGLIEEATLEIDRLEKTVNSLLDFARPKDLKTELVDINEVIQSICFLINKQCKNQGIRVEVKYGKGIPKTHMDSERIKQGLLNIVINAIQAMPEGGDLHIESFPNHDQNVLDKPQNIMISIKDTGIGIPAHIKDRIFDPFVTTYSTGTGLGLSITHSIIKEHNGVIQVESMEGDGTRFTVSLPINQLID
jgi:PAS domain S-box-containing protein